MRSLHDFELEHVNGLISIGIAGIENDDSDEGTFLENIIDSAKYGLYVGLFLGSCTATVIMMNRLARMEF